MSSKGWRRKIVKYERELPVVKRVMVGGQRRGWVVFIRQFKNLKKHMYVKIFIYCTVAIKFFNNILETT